MLRLKSCIFLFFIWIW